MHHHAPGGAMTSRQANTGRYATARCPSLRSATPIVSVRLVTTDERSPPLYRAAGLSRPDFESLWRHLSAGHPIALRADEECPVGRRALLAICAPGPGAPLCLSGDLVPGPGFVTAPLPLSWRLAALEFARRLPAAHAEIGHLRPAQSELPTTRPLRIPPRIPAPAHTIAPTEDLRALIITLRAHHLAVDELAARSDVPRQRLVSFVADLFAVKVVSVVPRPLCDDSDPFAYLGLHWSASHSLIHCTYGRLRRQLRNRPDKLHHRRRLLDRAFSVLRQPGDRRRLRHSLVPPPVIGEVLTHLRSELRAARLQGRIDEAIDLSRRILELDPSDGATKDALLNLFRTPHG